VAEVTVVVAAFDAAGTLDATLASLRAQTCQDWEAVVVDDGSADETGELAARHAAADPRIRVLQRPHAGVSAARNAGIAAACAEWLLFLDADDQLAPEALAAFLQTAAEHPDAGVVHAGWTSVPEHGDPVNHRFVRYTGEDSAFAAASTRCPFAIHAAIVSTSLVREVGAFDPTLEVCEDWDLWLRVARTGARFRSLEGQLALYRIRARSASVDGRRRLADGLRVINRAHAPDPRVANPAPAHADGAPPAQRAAVRLAFACYAAGLVVGAGEDASDLLRSAADTTSAGAFDPGALAAALHAAVPLATGATAAAWWSLPAPVHAPLDAFLASLESALEIPGAQLQVRRLLEEYALGKAPAPAGAVNVTLGRTCARTIDLDLPLVDVVLPAGVDRLRCLPRWRGRSLAAITLPAADGVLPASVLLDACVAPNAWDLLQELLDPTGTHGETFAAEGWTWFLREVWDRPDWQDGRFYDPAAAEPEAAPARVAPTDGEATDIELLDPLPDLVGVPRGTAVAAVHLAGSALGHVRIAADGGRATAQALRAAITTEFGFELCRAVVRGVIAAAAPPGTPLRVALAAGRGDGPARTADTLWLGHRTGGSPGTATSRAAVLPRAAAGALRAAAAAAGEPVVGPEGPAAVRYDPTLLGPPALGVRAPAPPVVVPTRARDDRHVFESLFAADADPWAYASAYETTKYEQTLSLIPAGARHVLELACAEGHFTERLARHVRHVDAVDISAVALERARDRCSGLENVSFRRADVFDDPVIGRHDVVVCGEVLYYAGTEARLRALVAEIAGALEAGGVFVTAHAHAVVDDPDSPGFDWDVPFGAAGIEAIIRGERRLRLEEELRTDLYRIQRYRRVSRRLLGRRPGGPPVTLRRAQAAGAIPLEVRERFLPAGGAVRREDPAAATTSLLPVLMYHRVAAEGAPAMRRWRTMPAEFEEQLSYLSSAGYRSATLEEWRDARQTNRALPGRAVVLTFDDGYADFETAALPLLKRYGFAATVFVVTGGVGEVNHWDAATETVPLMGWESLRRLAAEPTVNIGGHTATHARLTGLDDAAVVAELAACRAALTRELGSPPTSFAAPYGLRDPGIDALVGACGFEVAVTTQEAHVTRVDDLLALPRLEVRGGTALAQFIRLLGAG
jgi:peptidoglycan/xylan/chitin deacetylase (PgdA/CDA1 family)